MQVESLVQSPRDVEAAWLVVGIHDDQEGIPAELAGTPTGELVARLVGSKDLSGKLGEATPLLGTSGLAASALLVVGLGPRAQFDAGAAFAFGVAAAKKLAGQPRERVAVALPGDLSDPAATASAITQGLVVGTRGTDLYKTKPARHPFGTLTIVSAPEGPLEGEALARAVRRGQIIGEAVNLARDLANAPPAAKPPTRLAERARQVAEDVGLAVDVWDRDRIAQERFGGLIAVAAGSNEPPAFVVLQYRRGGDAPALALVGKGVTFDSGGLSLKPTASMEDMKCDMSGAAIVLAAMQVVARLELPVNLVGYLALTENMTGGAAMKLGDVLTMRNGKTVEVLNTDAEGRLILADALAFAAEQRPAALIDLATLTGACMVALGPKVAGLFANDDAWASAVLAACRASGERAWRLPLDNDYLEQLKSQVADLKNVGGKWGGAVTAAKFLEQFVGSVPWVHIDVAGPSWAESEQPTQDAGATGCFVRCLVALAEARALG